MQEHVTHEDTDSLEYTDPFKPVNERRRGGCGCWVTALLTLALVVALVGVGLFLPPVHLYQQLFGTQYAMLDANANAVAADGLTLVVDPADVGREFGVALRAVPMEALSGNSGDAQQVNRALAAAPPTLALQSPVYRIDTTGIAPGKVTLSVQLPPNAGNPDILDLYTWEEARGEWVFVPAQFDGAGALTTTLARVPDELAIFQAAPQDQPLVLVAVDVTQTLSPDAAMVATIVAPGGLQPTLDGRLTGSLAAGFDWNSAYLVMPALRNFADPRAIDPDTVEAILSNRTLRGEHVAQIVAFASGGYDGVMIDYRDLPAEQRENFSAFIRELGANLDRVGLGLGVVVPAAQNVAGTWETGAYDWRALGAAADFVQVNFGLDPAMFAPGTDRLVEAMLRWGVGEINRNKLLMGLSAQSAQQVGGDFTPVQYDEALAALGDVAIEAEVTEGDTVEPGTEIRARLDGFKAETGVEDAIQAPYIDYLDEDANVVARVWLTTADALRFRVDRTALFSLRGVAFEDLLAGDVADGVLQMLQSYKLMLPGTPSARELALQWRIEGADGVVDEVTTGLDGELVTTIEAPDGNYAINVEVIGGQEAVARGGAAVAVFAPTMTPTPRPTALPTATPVPTQVAQAAPVSAPVANNAGAIVVGNFEYGGHVTNTATGAASAMQRAGMNWMKVQLVYGVGMDAGVASGYIANAHSRGFKILLGIVGRKDELAAGGSSYISQYASFVGNVAALGPDAIEVWNEPNLDREWPTGQISGAGYVAVLQAAYGAIKGANGGVMVISGAPAPTGAEAAYPGQVMNDDRWLREVVAAGGLQFADCVGAHYNEGIISPTQRGGDPRDGYYTRYFWGMLDTYWSIIGGQKPICFTELGYLTPEGFPPLPGHNQHRQTEVRQRHEPPSQVVQQRIQRPAFRQHPPRRRLHHQRQNHQTANPDHRRNQVEEIAHG